MNFTPLIALPAIVALIAICLSSVEKAVLWVYLPMLLLLPNYFYFGTPPLNFGEYAMVPIGLVLCWRAFNGMWKWSVMDALVGAFMVWNFMSDVHAVGYADIFQRIAVPATLAVFPYMLGKGIIEQPGVRLVFLRRFVFFLFVDCLISTWEVRMGSNPARTLLIQFFPTTSWPGTVREGFVRAAGPFGHAILMGTIIAIAIVLHRYLVYLGLWERRFRFLPLPLSKEKVILVVLVAGILMTQSRGPWIAAFVGVILATCGTVLDYKRKFRKMVLILLVSGFVIFLVGKAYLAEPTDGPISEERRSADYRTELINRYEDIALKQSVWGWGTKTWPKLPAMKSVDNAYLLMTLMYGFPGLILYGLMIVVSLVRLLRRALAPQELPPSERALLFVLFAVGTMIALSTGTVYLGEQLYPLLFLFLGWSEACLIIDPEKRPFLPEPVILEWRTRFQFRSVVE